MISKFHIVFYFWIGIFIHPNQAALKSCDQSNGETSYCIPKENCDDTLSTADTSEKCLKSGTTGFNTCCKNITSRSKCGLWKLSEPKNHTTTVKNGNQLLKHKNAKLFNNKYCGISSATGLNRIAYGDKTQIAQFPWMAMLNYNVVGYDEMDHFLCGGSLISEKIVLTAGHCLMFSKCLELKSVRLGEHKISTAKDCEQVDLKEEWCAPALQDILITGYLVHKDYNIRELTNDIGLVQLARPAQIDINVKPICLPTGDNLPDLMIVIGIGTTEQDSSSDELLSAQLAYCPTEPCNEVFKDLKFTDKQFCAVGLGSNKVDSCRGDSGGPVQRLGTLSINNLPRMMQYGIVSGGINSCGKLKSQPGVYVKVTEYIDWIMDSVEVLEGMTNKTQGVKCSISDFISQVDENKYGNRMSDNLMKSLAGFG